MTLHRDKIALFSPLPSSQRVHAHYHSRSILTEPGRESHHHNDM